MGTGTGKDVIEGGQVLSGMSRGAAGFSFHSENLKMTLSIMYIDYLIRVTKHIASQLHAMTRRHRMNGSQSWRNGNIDVKRMLSLCTGAHRASMSIPRLLPLPLFPSPPFL